MAANKRRGWVKWAVGLAIVAGGGFGYYWYAQHSKAGQVDFKTVAAGRGDILQSVTANGQINPVKSVVVGSQISGQILDIKVDFNSRVKETMSSPRSTRPPTSAVSPRRTRNCSAPRPRAS